MYGNYDRGPDHIPLQSFEKIEETLPQRKPRRSLYFKAGFNFIVSAACIILLLLLFLHADGLPIDTKLAGLKIPSLVSFILSVYLVFIGSGISNAISEYKWVVFKGGVSLNLLDVYDDCTRGLSGFSKAFRSFHFNLILIAAFVLHVGLLIVNPASQEILKTSMSNYTLSNADVRFYYMPSNIVLGRSNVAISGIPPQMNGISNNYLTTSSFAQAANGGKLSSIFICPSGAAYCEFKDVEYISNTLNCQSITEDEKVIVNHNGVPATVVLKEYLTETNVTYQYNTYSYPRFFYSGDMVGRTYWDLANYTAPIQPGLNVSLTFSNDTAYDPRYRPYIGEQVVVMAHGKSSEYEMQPTSYAAMSFKKCTISSNLISSVWKTMNGTLVKTEETSSAPIVMDYDNVLGNNLALQGKNILANSTVSIMVNAYLMQQTILSELIIPKYYKMHNYLDGYQRYNLGADIKTIFELFIKEAIDAFDHAFFQAPSVSSESNSISNSPKQGEAVFYSAPVYVVDKVTCYIFCLILILPIIWWIVIWSISLKKMHGVGRGNSQVVLLAMNLTPDAKDSLRNMSNLDSDEVFKHSKDIKVRMGIYRDDKKEYIACGLKNDNNLSEFKH